MLAALFAFVAAIALPPKPARYVTDPAGILDPSRANALNEKLAQYERTTSNQILVYVDRSLPPGTTLEEMSAEAIRQWGVGQKGKDNGVILFVFVNDRKMRIEAGYGLEGSLTDAKSKSIIENVIKPKFKIADFTAGVENGVDAIIATIRGEPFEGTGRTVAEPRRNGQDSGIWFPIGIIAVFVGFFPQLAAGIILGLRLTSRIKSFGRSLRVLLPVPTLVLTLAWIGFTLDEPAGFNTRALLALALLAGAPLGFGLLFGVVGGLVQRALINPSGWLISSLGSGPSDSSSSFSSSYSSSSFSCSSSSSSSSSSGFSGGGGSGGGGGASGSW
jgi:uncharacterized protein